VAKLEERHRQLAQQGASEAKGEDGLEALDMELEAERRMLALVEATEQQMAGQGQAGASGKVSARG
jgi:hypothetical protein